MRKIDSSRAFGFIATLTAVAIITNLALKRRAPQEVQTIRTTPVDRPAASPVTQTIRQKEVAGSTQVETERHSAPRTQLRIPPPFFGSEPTVETSVPKVVEKSPEELAAEKAAELARYKARYMHSGLSRQTGRPTIAIAAVSGDGTWNFALVNTLAGLFDSAAVKVESNPFTPQFVSDGLFGEVFNGSLAPVNTLELEKVMDTLFLARETVEYSTDSSLENVITASLTVELREMRLPFRSPIQTWKFATSGAGFRESDARTMAEERLTKKIKTDTNLAQLKMTSTLR